MPGRAHFETARSFLAIEGWRNEAQTYHLAFCDRSSCATCITCNNNAKMVESWCNNALVDGDGRPRIIASKREQLLAWRAAGIPTILDVSPGYDGHYVWPSIGYYSTPQNLGRNGYIGDSSFGYDDGWRNGVAQLKGAGNVGILYTSWNGYTEGMTAMPARRRNNNAVFDYAQPALASFLNEGAMDSVRLRWLTSLYAGDPRVCDYWHFVNGNATHHLYGNICQRWQALGGQLDAFTPTSSEITSSGGNRVVRFGIGYVPTSDFAAIYFKNTTIGSRQVKGAIYTKYRSMGEDASFLGAPTSDEGASDVWCRGGTYNAFEGGWIDYCPADINKPMRVWAHSDPNQPWPGR